MEEDYEEFLRWAQDQGVELNGILPRAIPDRGIGLLVTKPVKVDYPEFCFPGSPPPSHPTDL